MTIQFSRETICSKFLNPVRGYQEKLFPIEVRRDPLTGDCGIIVDIRYRKLDKPDLSQLIASSLSGNCPFCPGVIDTITPRFLPEFLPEGKISLGDVTLFPNAFPYLAYSALAVLGTEHISDLSLFSQETLLNGFLTSQTYLKRVMEYDLQAKYCFINWNFLPPSSSSQVHPHLQILVHSSPLGYHEKLLRASQEYYQVNKTVYWSDLVALERELRERYIATIGKTVWLTSFIPRGWIIDVLVLFEGKSSFLHLSQKDLNDFCTGLRKVFAYMSDYNFYSFNFCLYSGVDDQDYFWTQARLIQRGTLPPWGVSDCGSLRLLVDVFPIMRRPEVICQEMKAFFEGT